MVPKQMAAILEKFSMNIPKPAWICNSILVFLLMGITSFAGSPTLKNTTKFSLSSVGNFVWLDRDGNGRQDPGEQGIGRVNVVLYDGNGHALSSTITDSSGFYLFSGLNTDPSGKTYQVLFKLPAGYRFSPKTGSVGDAANSDADQVSGKTDFFTLLPGQINTDIDAGMVPVNGILPLHRLELTTVLHESKVNLSWFAENEMNTNQFFIQRSLDGINYTDIASAGVAGQVNTITEYDFVNNIQNLTSYNIIYYRIKAEDNILRIAYSNIAPVRLNKITGIRVWPNPFVNDIRVTYNSLAVSSLDVRITDNNGQVVWKNVFDVSKGINQLSVNGIEKLSSGIYYINITDKNSGQLLVQRLTK